KLKRYLFLFVAAFVIPIAAQNDNQSKDARSAVNKFFLLLKSRSYPALYEFLPSDLQRQITREQLALSLMRLDSFILIERMEVGRVQQHGDFAVVNTTIYGKLKKPVTVNGEQINEGRVAAQQFLLREGRQWKVVTADNRTQSYFLKRNAEFGKQFQLAQPTFEFKQKDKWTAFGKPMKPQK
ncbi:MAG TPA: hypothetical protein VE715_10985, partial [Blastocatellia bacterium]|nr:hypothetical protein [Blastocatellia bacterium]